MQNAFGSNFLQNNDNNQLNNKLMNGFNNYTTTINGNEVDAEDIPFDLRKLIQDSLIQALGNKYISSFQTINNQLQQNLSSDSDSDDNSDENYSKLKDVTIEDEQSEEDNYESIISDFLEIIYILQIVSSNVESLLLKNAIAKCQDFKINLYKVIYKKKFGNKEEDANMQENIVTVKKEDTTEDQHEIDKEYRRTIEVEKTINEINKKLQRNRELLKNRLL